MNQQTWHKVKPMSHEEWLAWRKDGIGGSDAPAIMGVSPWATPFQKWEEKVFDKKQADNSAMKFGRDTEEASRQEFSSLLGCKFESANVENAQKHWLHASLDGICENGDKIVEIKKAGYQDHKTALEGKVPEKYIPQCQHILRVTGKPGMYYFSSPADGSKGKIVEVIRDASYIDNELSPRVDQFWYMVLNREAPALVDKDFTDMTNHGEWLQLTEKWKETSQIIKELELQEKALRENLIALSKDRSARGNNVSLSKSIVQGRIDYMAAFNDYIENMKAHYPDIIFNPIALDPYRKDPFVKWTLRDKG